MKGMLPEQRALRYASVPGSSRVVLETAPSRATLQGQVPARLLLDSAKHLVGVDIAPDRHDRLVVMLGPHENVDRVEDVRIHVAHLEAGGAQLRIEGHAATLIAPGQNPYLRG
jgi:hypothetical protein